MGGERQIEMTWRCSSCSAKNLGRFKVCQSCRNPKDGSEEYEMPADPSTAASVTEESLLRMALAGPDWRCAYCGSDQRRSDKGCASCGASALEGEEASEKAPPPVRQPAASRPAPAPTGRRTGLGTWLVLFVLGSCFASAGVSSVVRWNRNRPRDHAAVVSDVRWERTIAVERYQSRPHEGFKGELPDGAFDLVSLGQKQHHIEQVFDHNETEHYSIEVPDGYRTESYQDRQSCGEDCTTRSQSCSEKCTSNKNGFASCKQVCSGGGRSCTTKYCNVTKTRQIAKTRSESRTRQVPRYRPEPRFAEAFSYRQWEWLPARTVVAKGTDVNVRWPQTNGGQPLAAGEKEREQRSESYRVTLHFDDVFVSIAPADEAALGAFAPGTPHVVHTERGGYRVDGVAVTPLP